MFELRLQETGGTELQLAFTKAEFLVTHFEPIFEKLGDEGEGFVTGRFDVEGPGWASLAAAYAIRKARLFPGKTILRATDKLYLSFQKGNEGNIRRIGSLIAEFGSSIFYGIFHQMRRPIIQFSSEQEQHMVDTAIIETSLAFRDLGFDVV